MITISKEELEDLVTNLKLKHRAEIDAIMVEQGVYKRIIQQLVQKLRASDKVIRDHELTIVSQQKFELQAMKFKQDNIMLTQEITVLRGQVDRLKVALLEFDQHVRDDYVVNNEFLIQQLETENAHLRKLLKIPDDLFAVDPEEEKRKEIEKKKSMLKSIDDKLRQAEKKIQKKTSA